MHCLAVFIIAIVTISDTVAQRVGAPDKAPTRHAVKIELRAAAEEGKQQIVVVGLSEDQLQKLRSFKSEGKPWRNILTVRVTAGDSEDDVPPVAGRYRIEPNGLVFEPRYPFRPGMSYRVTFDPKAADLASLDRITKRVTTAAAAPSAVATVTSVEPSADRLPENLLKFYIHFSAPMRQGDVYRYIHLIDGVDQEVVLPFLELDAELWDPSGTRLTLLFDPGRVKRGVKPREDLGPALVAGRRYTLKIDGEWPDVGGKPLGSAYRDSFDAVSADHRSPNPTHWKIESPAAGGKEPLVVVFDEPLDAALALDLLSVRDESGRPVPGTAKLTGHATRWEFTPEKVWTPAHYGVKVNTLIEDLAGNSIARPFEVDLNRAPSRTSHPAMLELPFRVGRGDSAGAGSP